MLPIRRRLIEVSLDWEKRFGVAPQITSAISELDAALLIGCSVKEFSKSRQGVTAVRKGYDFVFRKQRYQVKANRPSGRRGSNVTLVAKAKNYQWDYLVWILYGPSYDIKEAWMWNVKKYRRMFGRLERLRPNHYRRGQRLMA